MRHAYHILSFHGPLVYTRHVVCTDLYSKNTHSMGISCDMMLPFSYCVLTFSPQVFCISWDWVKEPLIFIPSPADDNLSWWRYSNGAFQISVSLRCYLKDMVFSPCSILCTVQMQEKEDGQMHKILKRDMNFLCTGTRKKVDKCMYMCSMYCFFLNVTEVFHVRWEACVFNNSLTFLLTK